MLKNLEKNNFKSQNEILKIRPDIDCVHNDGFYFFDINIHRTMVLIEFEPNGEATIVWAGSHNEYETTFRNNKSTIHKWLKERDWIN